MNTQLISLGRIVEYFPGNTSLPNGMKTAPAIIVQHWESNVVNLNVFVSDPFPGAPGTICKFSIRHKDEVPEGTECWDWFPMKGPK